jgi:hypothetical protein
MLSSSMSDRCVPLLQPACISGPDCHFANERGTIAPDRTAVSAGAIRPAGPDPCDEQQQFGLAVGFRPLEDCLHPGFQIGDQQERPRLRGNCRDEVMNLVP